MTFKAYTTLIPPYILNLLVPTQDFMQSLGRILVSSIYAETDIYVYMIRLQDLITEITLGGIQPYATYIFTWTQEGTHHWETRIMADGEPIIFAFVRTSHMDGGEWSFAMMSQDRSREGFTVSHARSAATGQLNYLRLMRTAAEAILDFARIYAPMAIDITGSDTTSTAKDLQKTRIYKGLLDANAAALATAGYTVLMRNGKLWLVRKSTADSTGIAD